MKLKMEFLRLSLKLPQIAEVTPMDQPNTTFQGYAQVFNYN